MYLPSLTCYTTKSTSMRPQLFLYLLVSKSILKCFRKRKGNRTVPYEIVKHIRKTKLLARAM